LEKLEGFPGEDGASDSHGMIAHSINFVKS
jgi:hypothetical protein